MTRIFLARGRMFHQTVYVVVEPPPGHPRIRELRYCHRPSLSSAMLVTEASDTMSILRDCDRVALENPLNYVEFRRQDIPTIVALLHGIHLTTDPLSVPGVAVFCVTDRRPATVAPKTNHKIGVPKGKLP